MCDSQQCAKGMLIYISMSRQYGINYHYWPHKFSLLLCNMLWSKILPNMTYVQRTRNIQMRITFTWLYSYVLGYKINGSSHPVYTTYLFVYYSGIQTVTKLDWQ